VSQAPFARRALTVTGNDELGAYRVLHVASSSPEGDSGAGGRAFIPHPGQFAMLAAVERWGAGEDERPYLPRAFSVARERDGEWHFLLEDVGPGTRRLCELRPGDAVWALAPLGRGFSVGGRDLDRRRALLVGGGAGIAPLAILQDALAGNRTGAGGGAEVDDAAAAGGDGEAGGVARATDVTVLLGFRDHARAEGAALLRDPRVATDDGSVGHHGLVTDLLAAELDRDAHAVVYACGPAGMLEGVRALCERREVPAQLALEAGMACGFGACFGCVVPRRGGGYLRVCVDGPVIDAAELEHVDAHAGAPA
jgi:dihydroorotate dehydrogenase electron transfer subunit